MSTFHISINPGGQEITILNTNMTNAVALIGESDYAGKGLSLSDEISWGGGLVRTELRRVRSHGRQQKKRRC